MTECLFKIIISVFTIFDYSAMNRQRLEHSGEYSNQSGATSELSRIFQLIGWDPTNQECVLKSRISGILGTLKIFGKYRCKFRANLQEIVRSALELVVNPCCVTYFL